MKKEQGEVSFIGQEWKRKWQGKEVEGREMEERGRR